MLEPEHHFVMARRRVDHALLLEQLVAHAQQLLAIGLGQKPGPRLGPVALRNGSHHERVAERDVLSGKIGSLGDHEDRLAIVDMQHGRIIAE